MTSNCLLLAHIINPSPEKVARKKLKLKNHLKFCGVPHPSTLAPYTSTVGTLGEESRLDPCQKVRTTAYEGISKSILFHSSSESFKSCSLKEKFRKTEFTPVGNFMSFNGFYTIILANYMSAIFPYPCSPPVPWTRVPYFSRWQTFVPLLL